jgi:N-acetylmuramoyl-L-alanine amidase
VRAARCALLAAAATCLLAVGGVDRSTFGHSAHGRALRVIRVGSAQAERNVLVVGVVHGNEPAGKAVTRALRSMRPPRGVALWLVPDLNPDGAASGRRQNARGVDLNRNFPFRWGAAGRPFNTYYSGRRPLSEPETRAAAELVGRIKPDVSVWYHQHLRLVTGQGGSPGLERRYARLTGLPRRRLPQYRGTAISWENRRLPGTTAFVVELPAGPLSRRAARRHARAVLAVSRSTRVSSAAVPRPRIVQKPIPFPRKRKSEMRGYARRHYGIDDYRLLGPKVIVEHYTASDTFASAYNTFARDVPDVELHELPGVCSHYVVDKSGRIYQLVRTSIMCRHTVGLNWTAIGIEHVGRSDGQVLGNSRQLRSSLRLTRYLQSRFRIKTRNVIGHNESLSSPYHHERVARLRHQTHGDWRHSSMQRYRKKLRRLQG